MRLAEDVRIFVCNFNVLIGKLVYLSHYGTMNDFLSVRTTTRIFQSDAVLCICCPRPAKDVKRREGKYGRTTDMDLD